MYGHVDEFLYAFVAGIRQAPNTSAWAHVHLSPTLLRGLDWIDVTFNSPRGLLRVAYNVSAAGEEGRVAVELRVSLPPGVDARVTHPLSMHVVHVTGPHSTGGDHVWVEEGSDPRE